MQRAWQGFRIGWRETPWSFSLLLALLPFAFVVALAIDAGSGRVHVPPRDVPAVVTGLVGLMVGTLTGRYGGRLRERFRQVVAVAHSNQSSPRLRTDQDRTHLAGQKGGQSGGKR